MELVRLGVRSVLDWSSMAGDRSGHVQPVLIFQVAKEQ